MGKYEQKELKENIRVPIYNYLIFKNFLYLNFVLEFYNNITIVIVLEELKQYAKKKGRYLNAKKV